MHASSMNTHLNPTPLSTLKANQYILKLAKSSFITETRSVLFLFRELKHGVVEQRLCISFPTQLNDLVASECRTAARRSLLRVWLLALDPGACLYQTCIIGSSSS